VCFDGIVRTVSQDELAAVHSTKPSAMASSVGGRSRNCDRCSRL
jgi:hypothetical protein